MSTLRDQINEITFNCLPTKAVDKLVVLFKQQMKEIIGENEDSLDADRIFTQGILHGKNQLRAQLRQEVEKL